MSQSRYQSAIAPKSITTDELADESQIFNFYKFSGRNVLNTTFLENKPFSTIFPVAGSYIVIPIDPDLLVNGQNYALSMVMTDSTHVVELGNSLFQCIDIIGTNIVSSGVGSAVASANIKNTVNIVVSFNATGLVPYAGKTIAYMQLENVFTPSYVYQQYNFRYKSLTIDKIPGMLLQNVSCVGDSLTSGANLADIPSRYPSILQTLLTDRVVNNFGAGGEGATEIASRQGGYPIYANPFTIPADTSTAVVTLVSAYTNAALTTLIGQTDAGINPCTLNGISGTLTKSASIFYFARSVAGTLSVLTRPTILKTNMSVNNNNDVAIIWSGTNDSLTATTVTPLIQKQRAMIDFLKIKNYIIIGMTAKVYMSDVAEINDVLRKEYGSKFLDIRQYILNYGLSDALITPTTQDNTDIAAGEMPTSLRADTVHFNVFGYTIVAKQVKQKGTELGYW